MICFYRNGNNIFSAENFSDLIQKIEARKAAAPGTFRVRHKVRAALYEIGVVAERAVVDAVFNQTLAAKLAEGKTEYEARRLAHEATIADDIRSQAIAAREQAITDAKSTPAATLLKLTAILRERGINVVVD